MHRDGDAIVSVGSEQLMWESFSFAAEDEEIVSSKFYFVIRVLTLRGQKEIARPGALPALKRTEGIPQF